MAYVQEATQEDQAQPQQPGGGASPTSQLPQTSSGGGGGATGANTSAAGSPQGAPAVPNSSKAPPVQNLSDYLTANQPQALQMGQNIAGNITQQGTQVTGDINADQAAFDQQVQASNVAPNQDLVNRAASSPTDFVQNPNDVQAFQAQENANYTGPDSFEGSEFYEPLTQAVQQFQSNSPNTNTPAGVLQLVAGQEKNPTLGMENLDALLLGGTPGATDAIRSAQAPFSGLSDTLSNVGTTENANIATAKSNDIAGPSAIRDAFLTGPNAVVPGLQNSLQAKLSGNQSQVNDYNKSLSDFLAKGNTLNQDLTSYNGQHYTQPNFDFAQHELANPLTDALKTAPQGAPTLAQSASSQDYATEAALAQLLGKGFTPELDQNNVAQAGTFQTPGAVPDISSLASQIKGEVDPARVQFLTDLANSNIGDFRFEDSAIQNQQQAAQDAFLKQLQGYI